jgi:hypothetical protein
MPANVKLTRYPKPRSGSPKSKGAHYPFGRSIDIETYDRHAEKLRDELTLARIDGHPANSMNST